MILYNKNIFSEDPLFKFHFEEFDTDELIIHLGYNNSNLEKEIIGYRNTLHLIQNLISFEEIIPKEVLDYYNLYKKQF